MPEEQLIYNKEASPEMEARARFKTEFVHMEHSYLNAWTNFAKVSSQIVTSHFEKLIQQEKTADGLLVGLRALSACKFQAAEMRTTIVKKILDLQE